MPPPRMVGMPREGLEGVASLFCFNQDAARVVYIFAAVVSRNSNSPRCWRVLTCSAPENLKYYRC